MFLVATWATVRVPPHWGSSILPAVFMQLIMWPVGFPLSSYAWSCVKAGTANGGSAVTAHFHQRTSHPTLTQTKPWPSPNSHQDRTLNMTKAWPSPNAQQDRTLNKTKPSTWQNPDPVLTLNKIKPSTSPKPDPVLTLNKIEPSTWPKPDTVLTLTKSKPSTWPSPNPNPWH